MPAHPKQFEIAARIDHVLAQEIGRGIDLARMLEEARYARDVLLVCEACRSTELPQLAREFRRMTHEAGPAPAQHLGGHARQPTEWSNTSTGFGVSRPLDSRPASNGGDASTLPADEPAPRPARHWWPRWLKP